MKLKLNKRLVYLITLITGLCIFHRQAAATRNPPQNVSAINQYLHDLALAEPQIFRIQTVGFSQGQHPINILIATDGDAPQKPALYFNGAHHGNEKPSALAVLGAIQYIHTNLHERKIQEALSQFQLIFQPLVNPDGYQLNRRNGLINRDLNRDYPTWRENEKTKLQQPETRAVKRIMNAYHVVGSLAFHSGMRGVLWPWGHTQDAPPDGNFLRKIAVRIGKAMNLDVVKQSYFDYPTTGEFIDFAYNVHGVTAFTVELTEDTLKIRRPSQVIRNSVFGMSAFIDEMRLAINKPTGFTILGSSFLKLKNSF